MTNPMIWSTESIWSIEQGELFGTREAAADLVDGEFYVREDAGLEVFLEDPGRPGPAYTRHRTSRPSPTGRLPEPSARPAHRPVPVVGGLPSAASCAA